MASKHSKRTPKITAAILDLYVNCVSKVVLHLLTWKLMLIVFIDMPSGLR